MTTSGSFKTAALAERVNNLEGIVKKLADAFEMSCQRSDNQARTIAQILRTLRDHEYNINRALRK